jgi:hypothetical protein
MFWGIQNKLDYLEKYKSFTFGLLLRHGHVRVTLGTFSVMLGTVRVTLGTVRVTLGTVRVTLGTVCLFVFTRPSGTRDRLLLKLFPLPHCVLVQNVACYINSSRHNHTLLQVWARIHEGSHSSHASPWPLRPKVNILLTTCQTYCPVEV